MGTEGKLFIDKLTNISIHSLKLARTHVDPGVNRKLSSSSGPNRSRVTRLGSSGKPSTLTPEAGGLQIPFLR